ncbi:hypothetical protein GF314_00610 [bacterium]|nr:hypothetical protein [bacterium]
MPTTTATSTAVCRILYYGPANCGKRANLAQIQASLPPEHRLVMATSDPSREIAFSLRNGDKGDWQVIVQCMDAGQEPPVASGSRPSFDGVVFVCDSRVDRLDESLSAMEALKAYLDLWRLDIMSLPMVLQYNRRDGESVLAVDKLESLLNPWGLLAYPAAAAAGEGVRETLKAALSLTISHLLQSQSAASPETASEPGFDPGPPVPGDSYGPAVDHSPPIPSSAPAASGAAAPGGSPAAGNAALVIPVTVPRSALGPDGKGRIILEVHVVDG